MIVVVPANGLAADGAWPIMSRHKLGNCRCTCERIYLRRLSYLHEKVRFSLTVNNERQEYFASDGVGELFTAISSPYQLMHEPIRIVAREGNLDIKLIFAYQSWKQNHLWCFINNGRAVEGGTHEEWLVLAMKRLKQKLDLPEGFYNGREKN